MPQQPIEAYYWPTPNGHKLTIALEEMGLPYVIEPVNIGAGDQFKPEFLAISPNNRMPAIIDPDGPDGKPISVFESGAILQYLARKTGKFHGTGERGRVEVEEWSFWQVGGLGPMVGQSQHFRFYAPVLVPDARMSVYGANRYTNETHRLFGVMNKRLQGRDFLAGDYSIADMLAWPWSTSHKKQGVQIEDFPHVKGWLDRIAARPAVVRALAQADKVKSVMAHDTSKEAEQARQTLFGQRART